MNKYKGYLIVSDMDGTLINSKGYVSKENIDAISSFVAKGGLFGVATGRTEINVLPYIKDLPINCPSILYNGAAIYDINDKKYVKTSYINKGQLINPLKELLKEYKNLCMQIFTQGKLYIVSDMGSIDPIVLSECQPYEITSIDDIANEEWIKVMFADTTPSLKKAQEFLINRIPPGVIHSVFSSPTYLEVFSHGVSKGSALKELMEITGCKRERVIAIGDYCNDIEMVKTAGLGLATSNAHPLLKEIANITTVSNDEHAICNLIKRVLPVYNGTIFDRDEEIEIPV